MDPNFEAIVALKPDLVILLEEHEQSLPGFQKLGLRTTVVCHKYINRIIESLRTVASVCGVEDRGRQVADDIQSRLDRIREKTAHAKRPRVMISIDRIQGSGGLVEIKKMAPLVFTPDTQSYYGVGGLVGKAFSVGKTL